VNACVILLRAREENSQYKGRAIVYLIAFSITVAILAVVSRLLSSLWISVLFILALSVPGGLMMHHFYYFVQPSKDISDVFQTPLVPLVPLLGILVNIYVMCSLDGITWLVFVGWLAVGGVVYALYGFHNSVEGNTDTYISI